MYGSTSIGDMPEEVRRLPSLAIARPPMDLELLATMRTVMFGGMYIPPISARVEIRHLIGRSFHEGMLREATDKWTDEAKDQGTLTVSEDELNATSVLASFAVADLRNYISRSTGLPPMRLGRRYAVVIPECGYDADLNQISPDLPNRKLYKSDLLAATMTKQKELCDDILSIEMFTVRVVYGTDMIHSKWGYFETSKIPGRRQVRLDTRRSGISISTDGEWLLLDFINIVEHMAEDFVSLIDSGSPSIVQTMQSLEDLIIRLDDEKRRIGVDCRAGVADADFIAETSNLLVTEDGMLAPRNATVSIMLDLLVLLGIINVDGSLQARWDQVKDVTKALVGHDPMAEVLLILLNLSDLAGQNVSVSAENRVSLIIMVCFIVECRSFSGEADDKLATILDANWYARRASGLIGDLAIDLDLEDDVVVSALSRDLPQDQSRWMCVLMGFDDLGGWSTSGLGMLSVTVPHADSVTDKAQWVTKSRKLEIGDGTLIGEVSTQSTMFTNQETGLKYRVSCRDGNFIVRTIGVRASFRRVYYRGGGLGAASASATLNSAPEVNMTNEAEVLRDMIAGRLDGEQEHGAALWALAAIVKGDIKVSESSLRCFSHFSTSEDGPRLHNEIPCRLAKKLLLAETTDKRMIWLIGGSIPAVELEKDKLGIWRVSEREVTDEDVASALKGVLKEDAVIR